MVLRQTFTSEMELIISIALIAQCLQVVLSDNLEDLMIIDSLLKNYDRRATPTNRMGKIWNIN